MTTRERWTMLSVILGSGVVFLDTTIVSVALPKVGNELPRLFLGKLEGQSYVYNAYLLALSSLLVIAGALNDRLGRRRMFGLGLGGFALTSLLCAIAWNMEMLVMFRVLQGVSGAFLVPGSLALIRSSLAPERQGKAFGIWAGASGAATIIGPVLGGFLVDSVSWRAAFLMNLPLLAVALFALKYVTESRDPAAPKDIDWLDAVVAIVAVGGLTLGAIRGQEERWDDAAAFIALGAGALATVALPFLMRRSKHPLVPPHLFRSRNFTVTNISTFLIYGALYVSFFFLTLFIQGTLGYSATASGVALVPPAVLLSLFSSKVGHWAGSAGPRRFMVMGPAVMGAGLFLLSLVPADSKPWMLRLPSVATWVPPGDYVQHIFPGAVLFGIGLALMVAPLTSALMTSVPDKYSGIASAVNNAISRVGPQLTGAIIFIAISASFYSGLASRIPGMEVSSEAFRRKVSPLNPVDGRAAPQLLQAVAEESARAFRISMWVSAGLLFAGAAVNLAIRDQDALDRSGAGMDEP